MKLRKMLALLLALCLMTPAALAAPARDAQLEEMTIDLGMQTLLELVLGAAVISDVQGMEENLAPAQPLMEGILALGLQNGALAAENGKMAFTQDQAAAVYASLFTSGEYAPLIQSALSCFTLKGEEMQFDLSFLSANPMIGVHIYSTAFDGEKVEALCDLYTYYDSYAQSAQLLPEDAMSWLCHGEITLNYAPETAFGYTVDQFALSPVYLNGRLSDWQQIENTTYEYSVNLPSILGLASDDPARMAWQTADGMAEAEIRVHTDYTASFDETLNQFMLSNPGQTVTQQREFSQFFAVGEGSYTLWIIPEGLSWAYTISLSFPAERQAEFALYAEFIRNSMIVWGLSNG